MFDFEGTERFEVRRRLGAGGMGVVYEAYDRDHETTVALKTLRYMDANGIYRFKKEFRALLDLAHPNLIRFGELIEDGGHWFLTMELIRGVDILSYICGSNADSELSSEERIDLPTRSLRSDSSPTMPAAPHRKSFPRGPHRFDEKLLRDAMGQLALGLSVLHAAERVHRDVKPSNVLVTSEARVVLLDFGLMTQVGRGQSTEARAVGTALYMAPEQAASKRVGPPADWYSFGVVLYQALTGRIPFSGSDLHILMTKQEKEPPRPSVIADGVPDDLDELCVSLLRFDPDSRPSERRILNCFDVEQLAGREWSSQSSSRFTQSMPFVGRSAEVEQLNQALKVVRGGQLASCFVLGESGMGKSELVARFLELATQRDQVLALSSRCFERETVPYKAFDGIADALSRHLMSLSNVEAGAMLPRRAALLGRLFPVLRRVESIARAPVLPNEAHDPQVLRTRMFGAFRELLQRLAEHQLVVLFIDDLQWSDADSLTMLGEVFHRPDPPPVLLIATARASRHESDDHPVTVARAALGEVDLLELGPLSDDAARELVAAIAPARATEQPELCERIAREARGHPLFIQEIVRYLDTEGSDHPSAVSLEQALSSRIDKLGSNARALLEVLAIAGTPIIQEVAATACNQDYTDFEKAVAQLRVAFLARTSGARGSDSIETYHDRIRDSALLGMTDGARRNLHERLALALERAGIANSNPELLVRHLEAAGDLARAAQLAEQGAIRSFDALAFDRAAQLYAETLRLVEHPVTRRRDLLLRMGAALANAGRGARAAEALIVAAENADTTTRMECHRQAAEQLLICGHIDPGLKVVNALLAEIGTSLPATPRAALAHLIWTRTKLRVRGLRWKERHEKEIAESELTRLDVYKAVGIGLNLADTIRGADFQARHLLLALKTGEPLRIGRALAHEACYLSTQGEGARKRAAVLIAESRRILERTADTYLQPWVVMAEGLSHYMAGRFTQARKSFDETESLLLEATVGKTWELNTARLFLLFSLRFLGEIDELRKRSEEYMRDARRRGDLLTETSMRRVRNVAWLAMGRPDRAHRDLKRVAWVPPKGRFHLQHWYELESLCELALYQDLAGEAIAKYEAEFLSLQSSLLVRIQIVRAMSTSLRARLALAAAETAAEPAPLLAQARRAARRLSREDASYGPVFAALIRAAIATHTGAIESAVSLLETAEDVARDAGMTHCVAAAKRRRGQLLGGEIGRRLIEQAEEDMRARGVVAVERRLQILAPGFTVER